MAVQLSQVLGTARTYLNDDNATIWTDPIIIPKVQEAHRELQLKLWTIGSPIVRAQSPGLAIPINASPTNVTTLNPSGFPADMINPTAVFEAAASPTSYDPVTEAFYIPLGYTAGPKLNWWVWQQENLIVAPATAARTLVIQYRKLITIPTIATDSIGILFAETYLAARSAAICAGAVGNKVVYDSMTELARTSYADLLMANRGQQKPPDRP